MEINCEELRESLKTLSELNVKNNEFARFVRLKQYSEKDVDAIFNYTGRKLLDENWTIPIAVEFREYLLKIVSNVIPFEDNINNFADYQHKCVALSKLIKISPEICEYSLQYFMNKPPPFDSAKNEEKRIKTDDLHVSDKNIVKCCFNLLTSHATFFTEIWDWSIFIDKYHFKGDFEQKIYYNHVLAALTNMDEYRLAQLNSDIPPGYLEDFDEIEKKSKNIFGTKNVCNIEDVQSINWKFSNNTITSVESVSLPVYDEENFKSFKILGDNELIKVESTKTNLRNIAIGILSGKTICISGPVGCGKTTLVEYLAKATGRICPNDRSQLAKENCNNGEMDTENISENNTNGTSKNNKRKSFEEKSNKDRIQTNEKTKSGNYSKGNGFLRIQLGDQTDSKMLLGQYHCTDVPGEFVWSPGVLTQAVMNGLWLLLEDIDLATQDTFTILSNLLETKSLSVPGFRDFIKIAPGFQLFVTLRTNTYNTSQKSFVSLLNKYLYMVNIIPLCKEELAFIVCKNFPNLKEISTRMVDMYLNFSKGSHFEMDQMYQNTSERLVSTRDFIKLCQRAEPTFSKTSTECAFYIFQNAVDLFCSHLQHGPAKVKLIVSVGAKFGINPSRCEHYANDYKPDVTVEEFRLKIGRAELRRKSKLHLNSDYDEELLNNKRLKTSENTEKQICLSTKVKNQVAETFSFTRISVCLLEKVSVCINQNEPVLLVGETGVGKTSSIHYLASQTNHRLVVVNMNNQSDVSDLVGGFKPVDLSYILAPLRKEFENLFRKTFNETKNEKFLHNIAICYNQGSFDIIIKLFLKIIESVFEKAKSKTNNVVQKTLDEWIILQKKVKKLHNQLEKSANISFAFIPGALVNCLQNGDWILLDELNLASAETLECLSTILEPSGSIILLERGDFAPVKRHPNFRIFACMNPNTDVGKKDLPTGIRNRFTEFYVDELTTTFDLTLLINDYLLNTGIKKIKISNIVKLYKTLRSMSALELNDGLGNRPVYSLRNLCRALRICSKNLCGSIERNLYESFCLSFLTQLDIISHQVVLHLITENMLGTSSKAVLKQGIPKPGENYLNFEGYWIEQGNKKLEECDYYILTESVQQNLKDLARIISIGKLPILLQGPTSAGKTSLIEYIAKKSGNTCLRVNNHEHTDLQEYIGTYVSDTSGKLSFKEGVLVQAMRNGYWIILDELNLASSDILEALNRVLDDNRELFIPETQTVVKAHKNFMLFATQNPPGLYGGRKTLSRAFKNRFVELHFSEIPSHELEIILEKRCLIPKSYAQKMVKCMNELQTNRKSTSKNTFTLRDLFRWGNRYTYADKRLLENNSYDWNQHLVDEGYLVLSGKVRTEIEQEIICDALKKNFRKSVDEKKLFEYNDETSMVTKEILRSVQEYAYRSDIIWTLNMKKMAVLTAKSLQFNEPVLLVGPTGCGKTTICQILAAVQGVNLRILNCHMHTEGADFLGGLRPYRHDRGENDLQANDQKQLFEWVDGPLIKSMQDGSYFMADEISLAEDSVLERLNSVLEPERTILLAEKGGIDEHTIDCEIIEQKTADFVIQAKDSFKFLATMNPGGDFGKKELSPALRNRFTEIWCKPSTEPEDLAKITANILNISQTGDGELHQSVARILVNIVFHIKEKVEKFKFSVRDIIAWARYILKTSKFEGVELPDRILFGLETIFLDSLEMLCPESLEVIDKLRFSITEFALKDINRALKLNLTMQLMMSKRGSSIELSETRFGIRPFYIDVSQSENKKLTSFSFEAPTTRQNLFRLLSALSLDKAILLEGAPGVGKTSIIESLAKEIGYKIVRINLCEHTDLADLFGTDLPVEEDNFALHKTNKSKDENAEKKTTQTAGAFEWHNGPLLSALVSQNTWILLDELNLAPQSVLEGLNAILDHRGEVFIPELNKTFNIAKGTRLFACQNPLRQGGGRKGLPQSFLNRFTKVYLRKLNKNDLLFIINNKYQRNFDTIVEHFQKYVHAGDHNETISFFDIPHSNAIEMCNRIKLDLAERMVNFSEKLDNGITNLEFGCQGGGPYEINLRDILRWCDSLFDPNTGLIMQHGHSFDSLEYFVSEIQQFLLVLYERMKLVYYQRMRSDQDRLYVENAFADEFNCDVAELNKISSDISFYFTESAIYINDIVIQRNSDDDSDTWENSNAQTTNGTDQRLILGKQKELLKNLMECVYIEKPVLLCGPADAGKTKVVDLFSAISNKSCHFDNIDDSVTGSFQQIDFNRHLEEVSKHVENMLFKFFQHQIIDERKNENIQWLQNICRLISIWHSYTKITGTSCKIEPFQTVADAIDVFRKRIAKLRHVIQNFIDILKSSEKQRNVCISQLNNLQLYFELLTELNQIIQNSESLNSGGYFEWIDSKIVKCLKNGEYICLEHANLCSSAVLDRLNSVFEPDGQLLISEKGVAAGYDAECVEKHKNFRAFLTIDPKNGELSRAMRNRCIEIAIANDCYSNSDLKKIIYSNGITKSNSIEAILQMYTQIKNLTDFNGFNVSHLVQVSFLVNAYNRIGFDNVRALYLAGINTFVHSSKTDLMGYGIDFYHNKLKEIVLEASEYVKTVAPKDVDFHNVILTSKNLNSLSLVKLQLEPFAVLLKNYSQSNATVECLQFLFEECDTLELQNEELLLKFYVFLMYQMSKEQDIKYRYYIIEKLLNKHKEKLPVKLKKNLMALNEILLISYKSHWLSPKFDGAISTDLPWNTKIFNRLRPYKQPDTDLALVEEFEAKLSAIFLHATLIEDLPKEKAEKLNLKPSEITFYTYSQAVYSKLLNDKTNNTFVQKLFEFTNGFKDICKQLSENISVGVENFVEILLHLLWFKRFVVVTNARIFESKNEINIGLLDHLYLHFKWIDKAILKSLHTHIPNYESSSQQFDTIYKLCASHLDKTLATWNLQKKYYSKLMSNFNTPESLEALQLNELSDKFDDAINMIPPYGNFDISSILGKQEAMMSEESEKVKATLLSANFNLLLNKIRREWDDKERTRPVGTNDNKIADVLQQFFDIQQDCCYKNDEIDLDVLATSIEHLTTIVSNDDYEIENRKVDLFDVELLPLREYFLSNIFAGANPDSAERFVNSTFVQSIPSLRFRDLNLMRIINMNEYKSFAKMWLALVEHIHENGKLSEFFAQNTDMLRVSDYKKFSTFDQLIQNSIKLFKLSTLKVKPEPCFDLWQLKEINNDLNYNGPYLWNIVDKLLLRNGQLRTIAIKELSKWEKQLQKINELLWFNSNLIDNAQRLVSDLKSAMLYSRKLLLEVDYVAECIQMKYTNRNENDNGFCSMIDLLKESIQHSANMIQGLCHDLDVDRIRKIEQNAALLYSLIGCIQLHLITFTPLVDPIEKNRFKRQYLDEDVHYLQTLSNAYKICSAAMEYKNLGVEYRTAIGSRLQSLTHKKQKYLQKKLQKRPESHLYGRMIQDVNHFLGSTCKISQLMSIVAKVTECWAAECEEDKPVSQNRISECIKIIRVWILNSQQFMQQVAKKYPSYKEDILQPIECALVMTRYGFESMKKNLTQMKSMSLLEMPDVEETDLHVILNEFTQYPKINVLSNHIQTKIFNIIDRIDSEQCENLHIKILKFKFCEIISSANISGEIDENLFAHFDNTLSAVNGIWQRQEEQKRLQQIEEESMFVMKTRCQNENEEEDDLNAIKELFPTTVDADFAEFLATTNSLEDNTSNVPTDAQLKAAKKKSFIPDEEYKCFVESFMNVLTNYSKTTHLAPKPKQKPNPAEVPDLQNAFKDRLQIFSAIFDVYKPCINEAFDSKLSNVVRVVIKLHQDQLSRNEGVADKKQAAYNIYKDSNIPEVNTCFAVLDEIERRTNVELDLYPEHATLLDLIKIINRINNFATTSPIVRFNTGFQLLRQKLAEWNGVAHKNNTMQDLEIRVAEFVQRWTKLELQFWRNCLQQSKEKIETAAYKYWFFIYNLTNEYLQTKSVGEDEQEAIGIKLGEIIKVLKQYLESANYGDFDIRLQLLQSFELYLDLLMLNNSPENGLQIEKLIAVIYNTRIFYEQFSAETEEYRKNLLATVEKKLKELVKIESFNKDLSYFSMKNNIARVHRNLNKFIKEYEKGLKESVVKVFEHKEENIQDFNVINDKGGKNLRNDPKVKYYMIDSKYFIALEHLKEKRLDDDDVISSLNSSQTITPARLRKLFLTSRNVCKEIIAKVAYPNLTSNLEGLLSSYFETYDYLRNLSVDRSQEKSKQIVQNKNVLQQKRKALSDVFKTLTTLGVNYRTGLLEISIGSDLIDLTIKPFAVNHLLLNVSKSKTLHQNIGYLGENLNLYYAKCTHKMKILQNALQNPNAELGPANIERVKGFAIDMFLLVQNQRNLLSSSVNVIYQLNRNIANLTKLLTYANEAAQSKQELSFVELENRLLCLKDIFSRMHSFIVQYKSIVATIPTDCKNENNVFDNVEALVVKSSAKYDRIAEKCNKIEQISKETLEELKKLSTLEPICHQTIEMVSEKKRKCIEIVRNLIAEFDCSNGHLPIADSLFKLLDYVAETDAKYESIKITKMEFDENQLDEEIDYIVNTSLISIQNLFKKYTTDRRTNDEDPKNKVNIIGESEIHNNHLKVKICKEMAADYGAFKMETISGKIENLYLAFKHLKSKNDSMRKLSFALPIFHQYSLLGCYYIFQQLGSHRVSVKMLYVMLSAFMELATKGFCSPPDLIQDEQGQQQQNSKSEGGGFSEDNTTGNEKDVSDQIENEDQLDDAKRPEDRQKEKNEEKNDECKEEKGIDMSDNFDADMQDLDKDEDKEKDDADKDEEEDELDKEMGDTEQGAEKLDDQIWGSDNENEEDSEDEKDASDDEHGKGCNDENDTHNDLDAKQDKSKQNDEPGENDEQLDAAGNDEDNNKEKKQKEKDIDNMKEPEVDEDQINPYHNELEEPPEAEDMQLDENVNLDEGGDDKDQKNEADNPFDIDTMKETMEVDEEKEEDDADENKDDNDDNASDKNDADSDGENYDNLERDKENAETNEEEQKEEETLDAEEESKAENMEKDGTNEELPEDEKTEEQKANEIYEESKDKQSKEENIQSNETDEVNGTNDEVQNAEEKNVQQEQSLDDQETGEDGKGVGQANDEKAETGHQSMADTRELDSVEKNAPKNESKMKNKPQKTDENRTLGEKDKDTLNSLKTIDQNKSKENEEELEEKQDEKEEKNLNAEEYQHIKDADKSEVTAIDNANEEQSKQIQHLSDEEEHLDEDELDKNNLNDLDEDENNKDLEELVEEDAPQLKSEKNKQKSDKSKSKEANEDQRTTTEEKMEVEGNIVETNLALRAAETTAHCIKENLILNSVQEPTDKEALEMRKLYHNQLGKMKKGVLQTKDFEQWQTISTLMQSNARELCEQLRLILEPTKCTKLKGDYKTGRRINMKKIIPYIASQFRKDKIWLRRTKPSQRDYKITIAIDDSKSMHHNNSKEITLKAISLVSQALTLLESGKLSLLSFGESPQIILNHTEQFDGPKLVSSLNFDQNQSRIAELLDFIRTLNAEEGNTSTDNRLFENLLLILSDGRNIFSEGEQKVKNSVKLAKLQRIFIVYVIIDNPENKHSILDIRVPNFSLDRKTISMRSYLDMFPFPYYIIVRDLDQLPLVLSEAMRQWFELVNSEQ